MPVRSSRRPGPGVFRRRPLPIVAVLCVVLTTGACNPADVLHFLAGCKDASSSSSTVASAAAGDWTGNVGKSEGEVKRMWPVRLALLRLQRRVRRFGPAMHLVGVHEAEGPRA